MTDTTPPLNATLLMLRDIRLRLETLLEWRLEVSNNFQKLNARLDRVDQDVREIQSDMHTLQNTVLNFQNNILFDLAARQEHAVQNQE